MTSERATDPFGLKAALAHFRVARFRFDIQARTEINLPAYKGSAIRGVFGRALKSIVCAQMGRGVDCGDCILAPRCNYVYIFETRPAPAQGQGKHLDARHPFVLEPPLTGQTGFAPGENLDFDFVLIGRGIEYLSYFVLAAEEMGAIGLGKQRGRFKLKRVLELHPVRAPVEIYSEKAKKLRDPNPPLASTDASGGETDGFAGGITMEFLTPTRIKTEKRFVTQPEFPVLVRRLCDRLSDLSLLHHDTRLEIDLRAIELAAQEVLLESNTLKWYEWERYSNRQHTRMKLGGIVGTATYKGDTRPFVPLLALGEWVHVGKQTSFGLGRYRIVGGRCFNGRE